MLLAIGLGALPWLARPQTDGVTAPPPVQPGGAALAMGAFTTSVPIVVPSFHGIEPKLSLDYDSGAGNGFAGVGWTLAGFSKIERMSPGRGSPRGDASDIYVLDGQELLPCMTTTSPSCRNAVGAGTFFSTQIENFLRIRLEQDGATWTVWTREGVAATYRPLDSAGRRFGISSVVDTHGNTVTYEWFDAPVPVPSAVKYNGTVVRMYREWRDDIPSVLVGTESSAYQPYRVKTIDVCVGEPAAQPDACGTDGVADARRARVYALSYQMSRATGRSTLHQVVTFGSDAAVAISQTRRDGDEFVSAQTITGTSLPAMTLGYTTTPSAGVSFDAGVNQALTVLGPHAGRIVVLDTVSASPITTMTGDVDGDGRPDIVTVEDAGGTVSFVTALLTPGGSYAVKKTTTGIPISGHRNFFTLADVNGDGRADIVNLRYQTPPPSAEYRMLVEVYLASAAGAIATTPITSTTDIPLQGGASDLFAGDVNGDGNADLIVIAVRMPDVMRPVPHVLLSAGDGRFPSTKPPSLTTAPRTDELNGVWPMDVNGDGRTDVVMWETGRYDGARRIRTFLSNGAGLAEPVVQTLHEMFPGTVNPADFNGDGKADLVVVHGVADGGTSTRITPIQSLGNGFDTWPATYVTGSTIASGKHYLADVNGDGASEVVLVDDTAPTLQITTYAWQGHSLRRAGIQDTGVAPANTSFMAMDVTGDGKADLLQLWSNAGVLNVRRFVSSGGPADLLNAIENGFGGRTDVTYASSLRWSNANNLAAFPTIERISAWDGRARNADGSPRPAVTQYAFEGGRFDAPTRRFLGFGKLTATLPCNPGEGACPVDVSTFRLDPRSVTVLESSSSYDGAGRLLRRSVVDYRTSGDGVDAPFRTDEIQRTEYGYDGSGRSCDAWPCDYGRRIVTTRAWDDFGNLRQETFYGDVDRSGDERLLSYTYNYNGTRYIVGKPSLVEKYEGLVVQGRPLERTRYFYDQDEGGVTPPYDLSAELPPTRGGLTTALRWVDDTDTFTPTYYQHDADGNVVVKMDALSHATRTAYDETYRVFPSLVTDAAGHQAGSTWDARYGAPKTTTDENGQTVTVEYDPLGRVHHVTTPTGWEERSYCQLSALAANPCGDPERQFVGVLSPSSASTDGEQWARTYYDGFGRVWRAVRRGPNADQPITKDRTYDARGNVVRETLPYYPTDPVLATTIVYDGFDRLSQVKLPDGNGFTKSYALSTVTVTDPLGHARTDVVDVFGQLVRHDEIHEGKTLSTTYQYDARGFPRAIIDPTGRNVWSSTYDSLGRRKGASDPDRGSAVWSYDAAGRLEWTKDGRGRVKSFGYDALRRARTETVGNTTLRWDYDEARPAPKAYCWVNGAASYCNVGRLTTTTDESGTATYDYDRGGRVVHMTRTTDGVTYASDFEYDLAGRLRVVAFPDGDHVGIDYDGAGRVVQLGGIVSEVLYDAAGRPTRQTNANGTVTERGYHPTRRWLESITTRGGGATLQQLHYVMDADGKVEWQESPFSGEGWHFTYDDLERLKTASGTGDSSRDLSYDYDDIGNLTRSTSQAGTTTYVYPLPGAPRPHAILGAQGPASGSLRAYMYDDWSRLTQVTAGGVTQTMAYGVSGDRVKVTINGVTTHYVGDGFETTNGVPTKYFRIAGQLVAKRVGVPGAAQTSWLHTDRLGSVNVITDAQGAVTGRRTYRPYGAVQVSIGTPDVAGFIGERLDDTGLQYLHARYYDPVIGRFLSPDPLLDAGSIVGLNRYAYSGNDPVNNLDPSGRNFWGWAKGKWDKFRTWCDKRCTWGVGVGYGPQRPYYGDGSKTGSGTPDASVPPPVYIRFEEEAPLVVELNPGAGGSSIDTPGAQAAGTGAESSSSAQPTAGPASSSQSEPQPGTGGGTAGGAGGSAPGGGTGPGPAGGGPAAPPEIESPSSGSRVADNVEAVDRHLQTVGNSAGAIEALLEKVSKVPDGWMTKAAGGGKAVAGWVGKAAGAAGLGTGTYLWLNGRKSTLEWVGDTGTGVVCLLPAVSAGAGLVITAGWEGLKGEAQFFYRATEEIMSDFLRDIEANLAHQARSQ